MEVYKKHLHIDDPHILPILFGSMLGNRLDNVKIWLFLIGASSSGKTEILSSFTKCEDVYFIDSLTPNTFISHFGKSATTIKDRSLLPKLNGKTLIVKDISPISEMNSVSRGEIFSQLRAIYDGSFRKTTGLDDTYYESSFGLFAGCTTHFEKHRVLETTLGERFFYLRPRIYDKKAAFKKGIGNIGKQSRMQAEIKEAVADFIGNHLISLRGRRPQTWDKIQEYCEFLVKFRCGVLRDGYRGNIVFPVVESEYPIRVMRVLIGIYTGIRELGMGKNVALSCIKRIIADSCPFTRTIVLQGTMKHKKAKEIASFSKLSLETTYAVLDELKHIGYIVHEEKESEFYVTEYAQTIFHELFSNLELEFDKLLI